MNFHPHNPLLVCLNALTDGIIPARRRRRCLLSQHEHPRKFRWVATGDSFLVGRRDCLQPWISEGGRSSHCLLKARGYSLGRSFYERVWQFATACATRLPVCPVDSVRPPQPASKGCSEAGSRFEMSRTVPVSFSK